MNREVYCKDCKYYHNIPSFKYPPGKNTGSDVHNVCECPKNIDSVYPPSNPRKYISTPSIINRNYNCNWFIKRNKMQTFVWSHEDTIVPKYKGHGEGTFNINPKDGLAGFFIGDKNMSEVVQEEVQQSLGEDVKELVFEALTDIDKISGGTSETIT